MKELYGLIIIIVFLTITLLNIKPIKVRIIGKLNERKVSKKLKVIKGSVLINKLTFSINDEKKCQIDHVLVCNRGVFVIKNKNYAGKIYGNDSMYHWTQILTNGIENKFYSPVKENMDNINELKKKINNIKIFNCVIFAPNNICKITSDNVFTFKNLKDYVISQEKIYSLEEIQLISKEIKLLNEKIINKKHVEHIKTMQNKINNNICPRCGNNLIIKNGKNGEFLGCENSPKCNFMKK